MLKIQLAHEMSHSVNFQLAGVKNSFGAPIGETVFLEGLAMHANEALVPGSPDVAYTELASEPGWLRRCRANRAAILGGIFPYLHDSGAGVATRFTFGNGTIGMDRELYCAGWFVVGDMLASGRTFPQLARVQSPDGGHRDPRDETSDAQPAASMKRISRSAASPSTASACAYAGLA